MEAKQIKQFMDTAESFYKTTNNNVSNGFMPLLDYVYPEHDGNQDAEAAANLMLLRDRLNGIINGCQMFIEHINLAIGE